MGLGVQRPDYFPAVYVCRMDGVAWIDYNVEHDEIGAAHSVCRRVYNHACDVVGVANGWCATDVVVALFGDGIGSGGVIPCQFVVENQQSCDGEYVGGRSVGVSTQLDNWNAPRWYGRASLCRAVVSQKAYADAIGDGGVVGGGFGCFVGGDDGIVIFFCRRGTKGAEFLGVDIGF